MKDSVVLYPTNPVASYDYFGTVVSMDGDKMAVGAIYDDTAGDDAGAVYTYTWSVVGGWVADAAVLYPTNSDAGYDVFGRVISMSGDKMAVGVRGDDAGGTNAGAVYTYTWSGAGGWVADSVVLYPTNPVADGDRFGAAISMSGDKLVVGANGDDTGGSKAGAVYTYKWSDAGWVVDSVVLYPTNPVAVDDNFGNYISMGGDKMAVCAYFDDTVGTDAGAVYTFSDRARDPNTTPSLDIMTVISISMVPLAILVVCTIGVATWDYVN